MRERELECVIADLTQQSKESQVEIERLNEECQEQARLNGMGAEREAALMAKVERLNAQVAMQEETMRRAYISLCAFCSDEGWAQDDMDTMDAVGATLNSSTNAYVLHHWLTSHDKEVRRAALLVAAKWFEEQAHRETSWSASRAAAELTEMANEVTSE